ncbi:MAG: NusG domain II-containing protein [Lachnospira sp.]|nr:NusG domain II-containing protein [Lachnospira sp.]
MIALNKDKRENRKRFLYKTDLVLIVVILAAAMLIFMLLILFQQKGARVIVTVDGRQIAAYSLDETISTDIKTTWGENHLHIQGGTASVTGADCKDKLCVYQKAISRKGETIVCLPHKLVISIEGAREGELDGVTGFFEFRNYLIQYCWKGETFHVHTQ